MLYARTFKGEVRSDIFEQLEAFSSHSDVAFVSASPELIDNEIATNRAGVCNIVLVRHNEGYDFCTASRYLLLSTLSPVISFDSGKR